MFGSLPSGVAASTQQYVQIPIGKIVETDIKFNTNVPLPWHVDGNPLYPDLQGIGTHEIGHAIGLKDITDPYYYLNTMYATGLTGYLARTLEY